jgi:hypothetical protein
VTTRFVVASLLSLLVSGCISYTSVQKDPDGKRPGIRYALPRPYLLVTPNPDLTVTYQWLYLPDRSNQYVVTSWSFLAKYDLDVQVENGLLTSVGSKQDTGGVASQLISTLASIEAAKLKAEGASQAGGQQGSTARTTTPSGHSQNLETQQPGTATPPNPETANQPTTRSGGPPAAAPSPGGEAPVPPGSGKQADITLVEGRVPGPVLFKVVQASLEDGTPTVTLMPVKFKGDQFPKQQEIQSAVPRGTIP